MSVGISRAGIARYGPGGRYRMPLPEMIRVEEYINYHRHQLPLPEEGKGVRLDLQQMLLENGKTVVQVGITTPRALAQNKIPPIWQREYRDDGNGADCETFPRVQSARYLAFHDWPWP